MDYMRRITCRGVVLHGGKLLTVRLKQYKGALPGAGGYWCIPGGKLDRGESLVDNVRREMLEETGVAAEVGNLLYVQQFEHDGEEFIEFFFHITNSADYLNIDMSKASHGEEEIADIAFVDPAQVERIMPAFFATRDLAADAANYTGPKLFNYL